MANQHPAARVPSRSYDPEAGYEVAVTTVDFHQTTDATWQARIYQPQGDGPFPALLSVHGGAWTLDGWTAPDPVAEALAASGLVVAAIQLRRAPQYPYPASVADVHYGIRWLKAHARDWGADPERIGGIGNSSGGHLLLLNVLRPRDPRYAALPLPEAGDVDTRLAYVVALWPPLDPYARYHHAKQSGQDGLATYSEGYFQTEETMREGNPQHLLEAGAAAAVETLPPVLIIQGSADTAVTPAMQERFVAAYRAAGGDATLELYPEMGHGFIARQPGPEADRALTRIKAFVAQQLRRDAAAPRPMPAT
jgi:acetyl esterase/lipase